MHEDDRSAELCGCWQHVWVHGASGDVIDDVRACGNCSGGDGSTVGVDRDCQAIELRTRPDQLNGGKNARDFVVDRDFRRVGACRLAANVKDGGAGGDESTEGREQGCGVGGVDTAVGEGVRCQVEDGHDSGGARRDEGGEWLEGRVKRRDRRQRR